MQAITSNLRRVHSTSSNPISVCNVGTVEEAIVVEILMNDAIGLLKFEMNGDMTMTSSSVVYRDARSGCREGKDYREGRDYGEPTS